MRHFPEEVDAPPRAAESVRIYSRHLDAELWIASDETEARALERDLAAEGDSRPVITAAEAMAFGRMLEGDARKLFQAVVTIKRTLGGRLVRIGAEGSDA